MEDRLTQALGIAILSSKDEKVKSILTKVIELNQKLYYMDWNDWEEYSSSATFPKEMAELFNGRS